MLEQSGSMNMTGLTHPRTRTSETEGLVSQSSSSPNLSDTVEGFSEHGHTGTSWRLYLQVSCLTLGHALFYAHEELGMLCNVCMLRTP